MLVLPCLHQASISKTVLGDTFIGKMGGTEAETKETGWTKANLQKLLAAMKTSIPDCERMTAYPKGLKSVNWNEVAFPPFSPEACQEKWMQIFQKMRKTRTLTELINEAEGVISDPAQNSKNIHPELPKRPSPPNTIFYEENWAKFHEKYPDMARKKLFKRVLKKYQALPDEEKAQYVEKFKIAQEEYNRRMLEFRKHYTKDPKRECKKYLKRKRVSEDAPDQSEQHTEAANDLPPKPPFNGYNLFCKEQRASMTGFSGNTYVSVWAQRWRELTEEQRDEYTTRCKELQRQYSVKLHDYLKKFDTEKQQQILNENGLKALPVGMSTKRKRTKYLPGEPKKPSLCGNAVFVKTQMERLKGKFPNSRERFSKVSQMWQDLSIEEKERHKQEVHKTTRKYSMELQKWFKTLPAAEQAAYLEHNSSNLKYLNFKPTEVNDREGAHGAVHRPSDSEDEDIDSSSDEEEVDLNHSEVKEEEEYDDDDVIMFKVY